MSVTWAAVVVTGAATVLFKALGPAVLGGRQLPPSVAGVVELLAPAVLAALVVTQAVGGTRELVLDERLAGLAAAGFALRVRVPILGVVVLAAAVTALLRLAR